MSKLRSSFFAGFWFLLISLGQAYPYAVVYAHTQETQCGCNLKGRPCIHGCDLKKKTSAAPCHSGVRHPGSHGAADHPFATVPGMAQETSNRAQWISPNCSQQKTQKILSFQNEPFLPSPASVLRGPTNIHFILESPVAPAGLLLSCDEPPPKGDEPPQDPA